MSDLPSIDDLLKKKPAAPQTDDAAAPPPPSSQKKAVSVVDESVQAKFEKKMGQISLKERETEAMRFSSQIGVPHIDLGKFPVSQHALRKVPLEEAKEAKAICFYADDSEIRVGALDPKAPAVQEIVTRLESEERARVGMYVISQSSYDRVLELYKKLPTVKAVTKDISIKAEGLEKVQADVNDFKSLQSLIEKTSTTDLITFILGASLKLESSDVHIEAEESGIAVRFRLDGILHDVATLPKETFRKLVSRIKLVSSLKLNITDKPQDGRFTIKIPEGDVDVRVSTLPTVYGESVVMRLLRQSREGLTLDKLGFKPWSYDIISTEIARPNGMIITTGPTGSGKTTTLYAVMHMLNKPGVKIITLEDPVEYKMEGINQSQIDKTKDYTFGKGLRSILRQDPDIAMVGEIRDLETAEIAIQAALTGHLILSTLHTNSASGAIPRFLSMGVKPFLLAPALNAVVGQRLVRKLCEKCKKEHVVTEQEQQKIQAIVEAMPEKEKQEVAAKTLTFYDAPGCDECNGLGYKGRVGIYETLLINKEIEQMIVQGHVSEYDIEKAAIAQGMTTMVQDGILKAIDGITSLEEVFRVSE